MAMRVSFVFGAHCMHNEWQHVVVHNNSSNMNSSNNNSTCAACFTFLLNYFCAF